MEQRRMSTSGSDQETLRTASKTAKATDTAPSQGNLLNFDDVIRGVIPVQKYGRRYDLYDDIPTEIIMAVFGMIGLEARIQEATGQAEAILVGTADGHIADATDDLAAAFADLREETVRLCGDIFRHTYPDMSDDEIAATFSYDERQAVVKAFFTHRLAVLSERRAATTSDAADQALQQAVDTYQASQAAPGNRETRRAQGQLSRRAPTPRRRP